MQLPTTSLRGTLLAAVLMAVGFACTPPVDQTPVSRFGVYRGFSAAAYDGTQRTSAYLPLADGTRLAYDLILPTTDGRPARGPLPVLFKYTPYLRTFTIYDRHGNNLIADLLGLGWKERAMLRLRYWIQDQGHLMDPLFRTGWLPALVRHGYAVIVVERPGTGASFGVMNPSFEGGAREANEILNWIASQPWCEGNIGMFGDSWEAQIQFAVAATGNPHLKALFATSSSMDNYTAVAYPGGVYNKAFGAFFSWSTSFFESDVLTPVDSDTNGALLAQARAARGASTVGRQSAAVLTQHPFRDSRTPSGRSLWSDQFALYPFIERINRSGVPIYMTTGWYDLFTADMFLWYGNLSVPKRLVVRPLDHSEVEDTQFDLDYAAEAHRWFDYWLKDIDNGIIREPPLHYYVMDAPHAEAWRASTAWPLDRQTPTRFYLGGGTAGRRSGGNDGGLSTDAPVETAAFDAHTIDYMTTSGTHSRWTAINWPRRYPDMRSNDARALTYTTPPLEHDVEVVGHPIAQLWLTTDAPDLDAFVYLEDVGPDGHSRYVTEGNLRTTHRKPSTAPFDTFGLPYHSHFESDLEPIPPGRPIDLSFSLLPTAYRFRPGHRIRIAVTFADADNFDTPVLEPAPTLHLLREAGHASWVVLPVVQPPG